MMPWWFWVLLWLALAAASGAFLLYCGFRLFRGFTALADDAGRALDALAMPAPGPAGRGAGSDPASAPGDPQAGDRLPAGYDAVFADPDRLRGRKEAASDARRLARRERRVAAKRAAGRPQRWSDVFDEE